MYMEQNVQKWNDIHQIRKLRTKYPNESVIRFVKSNYSCASAKIMDLGCGAGRHVLFLASEGHIVTGVDFSALSIAATKELMDSCGLEANLVQSSAVSLPFPDESFDGIVCFGVLLYLKLGEIRQSIEEIHRVLVPGGKAFIVVRGRDDLRYGTGEMIEDHTFIIGHDRTNEQGLVMHFFDLEEIKELFGMFASTKIGFAKFNMNSLEQINSDYLITVVK